MNYWSIMESPLYVLSQIVMLPEQVVVVAAVLGAMTTFLLSFHRRRSMHTMIGYALLSVGLGIFCGKWLAIKIGVDKDTGAYLLAATGYITIPYFEKAIPTFLEKRLPALLAILTKKEDPK